MNFNKSALFTLNLKDISSDSKNYYDSTPSNVDRFDPSNPEKPYALNLEDAIDKIKL